MIHNYSINVRVSSDIESALCRSEHEAITGKAVTLKLGQILDDCIDVDNHFVNIRGVDDITVEAL